MGKTCIVLRCKSRWTDKDELQGTLGFYKIPDKSVTTRRDAWLKCIWINRPSYDPKPEDYICGLHFLTGKPNDDPRHPDFKPQLFEHTSHWTREKLRFDLQQYQRAVEPNVDLCEPEPQPQLLDNTSCKAKETAPTQIIKRRVKNLTSWHPLVNKMGEPKGSSHHLDIQPRSEKLQNFLEQYHRTGKLNDNQYRRNLQPYQKKLKVCLEKYENTDHEKPQPQPAQQERISFCDDCSSKRVREVKTQLEKLFTEKSWKPNHCGICNRRFLNPSVDNLLQKKLPVTKTTECLESSNIADDHDYVYSKKALEDDDFKNNPMDLKTSEGLQSGEDSLYESSPNKTLPTDEDGVSNKVLPYKNKAPPLINLHLKWLDSRVIAMLDTGVRNPFQPFKCKYCRFREYASASSFLKHMHQTHEEGLAISKPYICDKCSKQFRRIEQLQAHLVTHSENETFRCTHTPCQKEFKTKSSLTSHKRVHKLEGRPKPLVVCSTCGKRFLSQSKLTVHEAVHTDDRPFECSQCGKAFKLQHILKTHVRIVHDNDRPFICEICGKGWIGMKDLSLHMRTHSGEKPYSCDKCEYRCARKDYLNKHMRIHSDEKPFKCNQCSKEFSQFISLTLHQKKHHPEPVIKMEPAGDFVTIDFPAVTNDSVVLKEDQHPKIKQECIE